MKKPPRAKVGDLYVTAEGQTMFVINLEGQGSEQRVSYLATGKDVSKGWKLSGTKAQGGIKLDKFLKKIAYQAQFTGIKKI